MAPWSSLPGAASWACAAAQKLMATLPSSNDLIDFNGIPFRLLVSFEGLPRDDPVSTCAGDRFAVQLGNADQVLEHNWLQFLAGMGHLSISDRDEAPIIAPGIVQDGKNDRGFLIKAGTVQIGSASSREKVCQ